ncbi:inorganic diphosphatase [Nocardia sp. NBC_01329]|uniref:inorganic diphosphatase n=1 Tax=Nocardia sp. NBC_01329 TaxID=2903594 RepID=UPI002E1073D2|nr:inorganic diphosphatase [Nocardia sp. NBC_01329]
MRHGFRYEANYGFVPGTRAPDGDELDAYFLGTTVPLERAQGEVIAIVHRTDEDDDKLVVVASGTTMSDDEISAAVNFQEIPGRYRILRA